MASAKAERLFLTPPVAAEQLGVNVDRLRHWISNGELLAVNVGDQSRPRWRIHRDEWQRFLDKRSNTTTVDSAPPRRRRRPTAIKEFF